MLLKDVLPALDTKSGSLVEFERVIEDPSRLRLVVTVLNIELLIDVTVSVQNHISDVGPNARAAIRSSKMVRMINSGQIARIVLGRLSAISCVKAGEESKMELSSLRTNSWVMVAITPTLTGLLHVTDRHSAFHDHVVIVAA